MKKVALQKMNGFRLKLRPMAVRRDAKNKILPCIDDIWTVTHAAKEGLEIRNEVYVWRLTADAIHDFRLAEFAKDMPKQKQGLLKLLGFIWTSGDHAGFEPLSLTASEWVLLRQLNF